MSNSKHPILKLLRKKQNADNNECQALQKAIIRIINEILESKNTESSKVSFTERIEELLVDYSSTVNNLGFQYYEKIESILNSDQNQSDTIIRTHEETDSNHNSVNSHPNAIDNETSQHQLHNSESDTYCNICNKDYKKVKRYKKHIKKAHQQKHQQDVKIESFECEICHKVFSSHQSLSGHKGGAHKSYYANRGHYHDDTDDDDEDIYNDYQISPHNSKSNNSMSTYCNICNRDFPSRSKYKDHMIQAHTTKKPYSCNKCDKLFKLKKELFHHIRHIHHGFPYKCNQCDDEFKYFKEFEAHRKKKHGQENIKSKSFECDICHKLFPSLQSLIGHKGGAHKSYYANKDRYDHDKILHNGTDDNYQCKICGNEFTNQRGLREHELLHFGEKKFICPYCNKGFVLKHRWVQHIINVENKGPFKCFKCDEQFKRKGDLKSHQEEQHGMQSRDIDLKECNRCSASFIGSELSKHKQWVHGETGVSTQVKKEANHHSRQNLYVCDTCDQRFPSWKVLEGHKSRLHPDNSKYIQGMLEFNEIDTASPKLYCVCRQPYDDTKHMLQCDYCQEWYHLSCIGLSKDELTKFEESKFKCPVCNGADPGFATSTDLMNKITFHPFNPSKLYCICRQPYAGKQDMLCCTDCKEWYHFSCIGVSRYPDDYVNKGWQCPACALSPIGINQSLGNRNGIHKCNECSYTTNSSKDLCSHICALHKDLKEALIKDKIITSCSQCKNNYFSYDRHSCSKKWWILKRISSESDEAIIDISDDNEHDTSQSVPRPFKCDYQDCDQDFSKKCYLFEHIRRVHHGKPYKCGTCGFKFAFATELHLHELQHAPNNEKSISDPYAVFRHPISQQQPLDNTRSIDDKSDKSSKRFKCHHKDCNKSWLEQKNLFYHLRMAHGEMPYKCDQCDQRFNFRRELDDHQSKHKLKSNKSYLTSQLNDRKRKRMNLDPNQPSAKRSRKSFCDKSSGQSSSMISDMKLYGKVSENQFAPISAQIINQPFVIDNGMKSAQNSAPKELSPTTKEQRKV